MMYLTKWLSATLAIALTIGAAGAADTIGGGKVKSINADGKTFVVTDSGGKESTFTFGDSVVVNRAGKESKADLKSGDAVTICFDKGDVTWMAHYILVQEGATKSSQLIRGAIKGYDADKKELSFTSAEKKDSTYAVGKALVRVNMEGATMENVKNGDRALLIVDSVEGAPTLRSVMIDRAK